MIPYGTIWAGALWLARCRAAETGHPAAAVDAMLLRGLARLGGRHAGDRSLEARRSRRYFGTLLSAMLEAGSDGPLVAGIEAAMAARGIRPGWSNARARDVARGCP